MLLRRRENVSHFFVCNNISLNGNDVNLPDGWNPLVDGEQKSK